MAAKVTINGKEYREQDCVGISVSTDVPVGTVFASKDGQYYYDPNFVIDGVHWIRSSYRGAPWWIAVGKRG